MEYYFFINPVAGRTNISGSLPPLIRSVAQHCGIAPEKLHISVTQYPGHAREMAREAAASGQEVWLFAAGGDGTLNEVVSGAMGSPNAAVGCLPYGSGNDFLRNFGEQEEFCDLENQLRGGTMPIDLIQTQRGCAASSRSRRMQFRLAWLTAKSAVLLRSIRWKTVTRRSVKWAEPAFWKNSAALASVRS